MTLLRVGHEDFEKGSQIFGVKMLEARRANRYGM